MTTKSRHRRPAEGPARVAIYCRISLDATGEALGVERQEQLCRELCERNGWDAPVLYVDNDISAYSGRKRPEFERMLETRPTVIVVWHLDRLVRRSADLARVVELECQVHAVTAGVMDLSNPQGLMVARMVVTIGEYESDHKGERQRAAGRQRATKGKSWWGSRPFGYERDGTLREREAKALRMAYAGVLAGKSVAELTRDINADGHLTPFGKPWGPASLRPVLLNARNAAIRVYDGEEIGPAAWSPVVPEDTYRAVVRVLTNPARGKGGQGPKSSALLTGIATCGVCGSGVKQNRRYHWKKDGTSYPIYVCRDGACASVPVDYVDGRVFREVMRVLPDPSFHAAWTGSLPDQTGDAVSLMAEERTLTKRLKDAADDYADDLLTREQLRAITDKTRDRMEEVQEQLANIGSRYDLTRMFGDVEWVSDEIDRMSMDERRALVSELVASVELFPRPKGTKRMTPESVVIQVRGVNP